MTRSRSRTRSRSSCPISEESWKPVASLDSSTRSAARATYSAYKRQPIRWRLAGGSAALTLVILLGFAVIVGTLTTRAIYKDFNRQVASAADRLQAAARLHATSGCNERQPAVRAQDRPRRLRVELQRRGPRRHRDGALLRRLRRRARTSGKPTDRAARRSTAGGSRRASSRSTSPSNRRHYYTHLRPVRAPRSPTCSATANRVKLFLGLGVLGGAALALLAGLATARRAMEPIAELTDAAREIERTRDPAVHDPAPGGRRRGRRAGHDARVDAARARRRAHGDRGDARAPARVRRRRLARAAHAADVGAGQPRAARGDAARRAPRGRRLRPALQPAGCAGWSPTCCCSPARTPAASRRSARSTSRASSPTPRPSSSRSPATTRSRSPRPPGLEIEGVQDELHRLVLNLMENALRHTDPGTAVEASVERSNGHIVLAVEDDGPGIPAELRDKVFERFFRAHGDRSGSSGLGLAIVTRRGGEPPGQRARSSRRSTGAARGSSCASPRRARQKPRQVLKRSALRPMVRRTCLTSLPSSSWCSRSAARSTRCPIGAVHEIIRYTEPRSVTSDVPWIRGVIGLRGKIIPIYDLAQRMGLAVADAEFGKIVIVETGHRPGRRPRRRRRRGPDRHERAARGRPDRRHADDRVDRQDRRPPRHPAQPGGSVRPRRRRRRAGRGRRPSSTGGRALQHRAASRRRRRLAPDAPHPLRRPRASGLRRRRHRGRRR